MTGAPRLSVERLEEAQAKLPNAKLGIEGNAWLNEYADDLLHDLKLERERAERLDAERRQAERNELASDRLKADVEARLGRAARQLEAIAFNAESHHAGEDGKARALSVIAQWARDPDSVPEGVGAALVEQEKEQG